MKRWTTPTQPVLIEGAQSVAESADVYVTLRQGCHVVTVKNPPRERLENGDLRLLVTLTQQQTAQFQPGQVRVQANVVDATGYRDATGIERAAMGSNILDEEVTHG